MTSEQTAAARDPAQSTTPDTGLGALLARIFRGVRQNRGLVGAMLLAAAAEAALHKLPLLLLQPIFDSLAPNPNTGSAEPEGEGGQAELLGAEIGNFSGWLLREFERLSHWFTNLVGLEFTGEQEKMGTVVTATVILVLIAPLGAFAIYFATLLSRYFASKVIVDLRNELAEHLLHLPLRFYGRERLGELLSRLTNDTSVLGRSFTLVADNLVIDCFHILAIVVLVGLQSDGVGLIFLLPAIPIMGLPMIKTGKKVQKRSRGSLAAMGDATESMNQMLSGIKTVKAFQLEDVRLRDYGDSNDEYLRRTKRMLESKARSQASTFVAYQVGFGAMVAGLAWLVLATPTGMGQIVAILAPSALLYTHIKRVARAYNAMMESAGAMDRIEAILHEEPDVSRSESETSLGKVDGRVELEGLEFAYGEEPVLRGVDLTVEPGQTIAFVGPSGAGKSTCIDLIARFHDPSSGAVRIDGHDLRAVDLKSFRKHTALVSQQPFLFNASIFDNIVCGRPDATRDEVLAAAKAAQVDDFVQTLPDGYETLCGERGSNLSGGQMQRITIARALVRDPAILFLDEATSALDSESEEAVQNALQTLMEGRTAFVIAHRLSSVRDADRICVFDDGRIVESGTHSELAERGGLYSRLLELQELS